MWIDLSADLDMVLRLYNRNSVMSAKFEARPGSSSHNDKLRKITGELQQLAADLKSLSEQASLSPSASHLGSGRIRALLRARHKRAQFFGPNLFGDPAWDILLELLAARLEGRQISVSSLCVAAAVPPTTALRWIRSMTDGGLLVRTADEDDGRRVYVKLSEHATSRLEDYFNSVAAEPGV